MPKSPLTLEQLARAEISKRYNGEISLTEFISFFYIPEDAKSHYFVLCSEEEKTYIQLKDK